MRRRPLHSERELECEQDIEQRSRKSTQHRFSLQAGFAGVQYQIHRNRGLRGEQNSVSAALLAALAERRLGT